MIESLLVFVIFLLGVLTGQLITLGALYFGNKNNG